jgi:hypothetical protein
MKFELLRPGKFGTKDFTEDWIDWLITNTTGFPFRINSNDLVFGWIRSLGKEKGCLFDYGDLSNEDALAGLLEDDPTVKVNVAPIIALKSRSLLPPYEDGPRFIGATVAVCRRLTPKVVENESGITPNPSGL